MAKVMRASNGKLVQTVSGKLATDACPVRYTKCSDSTAHLWLPCSYPASIKIGSDCWTRDCIVDETQTKTAPAYTTVAGCGDPACGGGNPCPSCLPTPMPASITVSFSGISIGGIGVCCESNRLSQGSAVFSGTYTLPQTSNPCLWELIIPYSATTVRTPCTGTPSAMSDTLDIYILFSASGGVITRKVAAYIGAYRSPFSADLFYASDIVTSCQNSSVANQSTYVCGSVVGTGGTASYTL